MAEKKYLDLTGLTSYDQKLKNKTSQDLAQTLQSAKDYADGLADNYDPAGTAQTKFDQLSETVNTKADKATTLQGYGITDAYTKEAANSEIARQIAAAGHLEKVVLEEEEELPEVGSAKQNAIYMKPLTGGKGNNIFEEYMVINGAWEKLGTTDVDLSNYATKGEVATAKTEAISSAVQQAKSYADGLGTNYATAAQGTKADTALQKADIAEGATNGTIAVKGTDVAVHGLKSAAYAETSAFDAAGTASSAVSALENGQVATNKNDIATLKEQVAGLTTDTYKPISEEEISALFS